MRTKASSAFCKVRKVWPVVAHDMSNGRCIALSISLSYLISLCLDNFSFQNRGFLYDSFLVIFSGVENERIGETGEDVKLGRYRDYS